MYKSTHYECDLGRFGLFFNFLFDIQPIKKTGTDPV